MNSGIGAIFDWDGVIVDSHDQHQESWFLLAAELGRPMSKELFVESFGKRNEQIIPDLFRWAEPGDHGGIAALADRKEEIYRELVRKSGIEPLPGVRDLLDSLHESNVPCAVGTSTPRENIAAVLALLGLEDRFAAVSASEDVVQGKPDPEVFLIAAERIGRVPADCVVFEDAHAGIEAGRAAGMKTIAVTTTHPRETFSGTDLVVDTLEEVSLERLLTLVAERA